MKNPVILLGDPHIGKSQNIGKNGIGVNFNSKITDQFNLLDFVLEKALEYHCQHIIVTGDIFDEPKPHPNLITSFIRWLKKCELNYVNVHLILGNHDIIRVGSQIFASSLDIISEMELDNVSVYKQIDTIFIENMAFTLLPFRDRKHFGSDINSDALNIIRESISYELASIPSNYKKIVIGHLAIVGSIPVGDEIDDLANELFCPLDMFAGYDYVWMGHVHKPQIMNHSPYIAHIGSMDISNFGETDQKKNIIILHDDGFGTEYLPVRPMKKISLTVPSATMDPTQFIIDQISQSHQLLDQSTVRLEVCLSSPELKSINKPQIEKFLHQQGVFNIVNISESRKINHPIKKDNFIDVNSKIEIPTVIKAYADKYVEPSIRDEFIEISMEVYNQYKSEIKE